MRIAAMVADLVLLGCVEGSPDLVAEATVVEDDVIGCSSIILTSNKTFAEMGQVFGDEVLASAIVDRLL